jgi:DNA modification methylase
LRDYGLPPTVWGGAEGCAHAWAEETVPTEVGLGNWAQGVNGRGEVQPGGVEAKREPIRATAIRGVCTHCGAWRGSLGLEPTPEAYVAHLVEVCRAVRRVLRSDGTCWVNLGDAYSGGKTGRTDGDSLPRPKGGHYVVDHGRQRPVTEGLKPKDLVGIPWRVAFALQADGWYLRSEIIWAKPNPMPESVTDRPTKAHEQLFLLAKTARYFYDGEAIREPHTEPWRSGSGEQFTTGKLQDAERSGENASGWWKGEYYRQYNPGGRSKRSVWTIPSAPFAEAHFATFPPALVEPCVQAGTSARGACPACGAPWRRAVERGAPTRIGGNAGVSLAHSTGPMDRGGHGQWDEGHMPKVRPTVTLGWTPTCPCDDHVLAGDIDPPIPDPVPCVVLDPFAGAGTVGLVADRLGRDAILIELKPAYAAMAERRIREEAPLLTAVEVEAAAPAASDNGHGAAAPEQLALEIGG